MTGSSGKLIAFGVFAIPLFALGMWVWMATPEGGSGPSRRGSGGSGGNEPGALVVSLSRVDGKRIRVTYSNASSRRIAIVVPASPAGVLRIVKPGVPDGKPRALSFHAERDARVELLPGGAYNQTYRIRAAVPVEAIYDSRGPGLPTGTWRGLARSGGEGDEKPNGG